MLYFLITLFFSSVNVNLHLFDATNPKRFSLDTFGLHYRLKSSLCNLIQNGKLYFILRYFKPFLPLL